jgi:hypothetical protein
MSLAPCQPAGPPAPGTRLRPFTSMSCAWPTRGPPTWSSLSRGAGGVAAGSVRAWLDAGTVGCFGAAFGCRLGHGTPVPQPADHLGDYRRSDPRRAPGIPLVPTGIHDPFEYFRIRPSTRAPLRNRTVDLLLTMHTGFVRRHRIRSGYRSSEGYRCLATSRCVGRCLGSLSLALSLAPGPPPFKWTIVGRGETECSMTMVP